MIEDVKHFMTAVGHSPSHKMVALYHDLVREEVGELEEAMAAYNSSDNEEEEQQSRADSLDAICDSIWVLIGLAQSMRLPLEWGWDAVASTNLKKIDPELGIVRRDENGKIIKPARWSPPDMLRIIKTSDRKESTELPGQEEAYISR